MKDNKYYNNNIIDKLVDTQYHCNKQGIQIDIIQLNEQLRQCYVTLYGSNRDIINYSEYIKAEKKKNDWQYEMINDVVEMLAIQKKDKQNEKVKAWLYLE